MSDGEARRRFVDAVRLRLDETMTAAGLPFNNVQYHDGDPGEGGVSILYEGLVPDFLDRYPGLDPVWDEEWRQNTDGCVDLWIRWLDADGRIDCHLEHWDIGAVAERYGDSLTAGEVDAALAGPGEMEVRVEVIATLLERALATASAG